MLNLTPAELSALCEKATPELKPCPFCGGTQQHIGTQEGGNGTLWYHVRCGLCDAESSPDLGKSGAIEVWNTRPGEAALLAENAALTAERDAAVRALADIWDVAKVPEYGTFVIYINELEEKTYLALKAARKA